MSGLKVLEIGDVKVYNLTAGRAVPDWLSETKRRKLLKKDPELKRRVELLQNFDFPTVANSVKCSPDGEYIVATGTYKPRIRCFETSEMAMKFERYLNCEAPAVEFLSDDYSKLAILMADRFVELHAAYGYHYRTRIPKYGRDLAYARDTCDLLISGDDHIYRLNLDEGRFVEPFVGAAGAGINKIAINPANGLLSGGNTEGCVECYDARSGLKPIATLDVMKGIPPLYRRKIKGISEVTALTFLRSGLDLGVGLSSGQVLMYDIRAQAPVLTKNHSYGLPIKKIIEHSSTDMMVSADAKVVKIWEKGSGEPHVTFEADADINDVESFPNSGLFFVAGEQKKLMTYFLPSLGTAPTWCSYLDTITEELESSDQPVVYDDFKFVTKKELRDLGLTDLLGTNMLKAYMHGFFVDARLYNEATQIANPFAHEEYKRDQIKKKLEEGAESRLQLNKLRWKLPKINQQLAKKMAALKEIEEEKAQRRKQHKKQDGGTKSEGGADIDDEGSDGKSRHGDTISGPRNEWSALVDQRFGAIFEDADFEVNEQEAAVQGMFKNVKQSELEDRMAMLRDIDDDDSESDAMGSDDDGDDMLEGLLGLDNRAIHGGDDSDGDGHGEGDGANGADAEERKRRLRRQKEKELKKKIREKKRRKEESLKKQQEAEETRGPQLQKDHDDVDIKPMQASRENHRRRKMKGASFSSLLTASRDGDDEDSPRGRGHRRLGAGSKQAKMLVRKQPKKGKKPSPEDASRREGNDGSADGESDSKRTKRGVRGLGLSRPSKYVYYKGRKVKRS